MDYQNRLLIAIVLSVLTLLIFQKLFVASHAQKALQQESETPVANRIITVSSQKKATTHTVGPEGLPSSKRRIVQQETLSESRKPTQRKEKITILENEVFKIKLTDDGARIKQIWLKRFKDSRADEPVYLLNSEIIDNFLTGPLLLEDLFLEKPITQNWEIIDRGDKYVKYSLKTLTGALITKDIYFHNSKYGIWLRLNIKNDTTIAMPIKYKLTGGAAFLVKPGIDERFISADVKIGQEIKRLNPKRHLKKGSRVYYESPSWISIKGRYFSMASEPKQEEMACFFEEEKKGSARSGIIIGPLTLKPQETITKEFLLYAGPNDIDELRKVTAGMKGMITYGKLNAICVALLKILKFFNSIVNNYGLSIIMLVIVISAVLYPLTAKSLKSMKEMQQVQPEVESLRKEYKNNPQKLQKEIMELYKKHKINPLGGCLPMFFQMPIFIALYQVLARSVKLKGANFLWIKDLSEPDAAFKLPGALPIIGEYVNILPILMIISMFLQQKISQPKAGQSEQQKMMAIIMPLLFGVIFYNLPSGLVLYWLTNTIIMIILQEFVLKTRHITLKSA